LKVRQRKTFYLKLPAAAYRQALNPAWYRAGRLSKPKIKAGIKDYVLR